MKEYILILVADDCGERWSCISDDIGNIFEFMEEIRENEFHGDVKTRSILELDFDDLFIEVIELSDIPEWWYVMREKEIGFGDRAAEELFGAEIAAWRVFDAMLGLCDELVDETADADLPLLERLEKDAFLHCIRDEAELIVNTGNRFYDMHVAVLRKLEILGAL